MSARGLTGQCLALQRFGFEGERGLREDCLDGAGRCWMAGRCLSFRLTKDRVLCLIPDKPLSRRTRAGFRCAWSGMCRTTANRAAHAAEAYWRSLHAHAASTRAAASAVSLSVSSPAQGARTPTARSVFGRITDCRCVSPLVSGRSGSPAGGWGLRFCAHGCQRRLKNDPVSPPGGSKFSRRSQWTLGNPQAGNSAPEARWLPDGLLLFGTVGGI